MTDYNHIPIDFKQSQLIEKDDGHYYQTPSGEVYPSITTILHKTMSEQKQQSLQDWKDQEVAAEYITQESTMLLGTLPPQPRQIFINSELSTNFHIFVST